MPPARRPRANGAPQRPQPCRAGRLRGAAHGPGGRRGRGRQPPGWALRQCAKARLPQRRRHPPGCTRRCSWPRQRRASGHRLLEPTRAPPLARPPHRSAPPAEATSPPRSPAAGTRRGAPPLEQLLGEGGALSGVLTPPAPHCSLTAPYPEPQVLKKTKNKKKPSSGELTMQVETTNS